MKDKIVLIGGGGHCRAVIDVIEAEDRYSIAGIIDLEKKAGTNVLGYPIIGTDEDLPVPGIMHYAVTIGQIKSFALRNAVIQRLEPFNVFFPRIISPHAYVSPHAVIGEGCVVMHNALINAGATIGRYCIINSFALLEHDVHVGDFCHISTGAVINGEVRVGNGSFIGSHSTINHTVIVPPNVIIASGTTVRKKDILDSGKIYFGNPVREYDGK